LGGLIAMVASNPQMLQVITGLLSNDGGQGGLGGLMAKFQQAGLGDAANSWVGSGENQAVTGDQMSSALGEGTMADLAAKLGMSQGDAAGSLANMLPGLIDKAMAGDEVVITRHGKPQAVVIGFDDWQRLNKVPSFGQLLMSAPVDLDEFVVRDTRPMRAIEF